MPPLPRSLTVFCGVVCGVVLNVTMLVEGALRDGYDPLAQFISELSLGPRGHVQHANFFVSGVLVAVFGAGLVQARLGPLRRAGPAVVVVGVALVVAGVFDTDPFPRALVPTVPGALHDLAAFVVFSAMIRALSCFAHDADDAFVGACAIVVGVLFAVMVIGFPYAWKPTVPIATDLIGLWQRLAEAAFFVGAGRIALWLWKQPQSST